MSEKSATTYTVLYLRFKLRVPPDALACPEPRSRYRHCLSKGSDLEDMGLCRRRSLRWEACIYLPTVKLRRLT